MKIRITEKKEALGSTLMSFLAIKINKETILLLADSKIEKLLRESNFS